ncbi:MAG: hypothetical protein V8S72_01185 [Oscillospiraceae bacterium]
MTRFLRQRFYEADYQSRQEDEQKQCQRDAEDDRCADDDFDGFSASKCFSLHGRARPSPDPQRA